MVPKGGISLGLVVLLILGGCATSGERQAEEQQPSTAVEDGPPREEGGKGAGGETEDATAEGLGAQERAEGAALEDGDKAARPEEVRVFFEFDSSELSEGARELIRKHADYIKAHPETEVTLEGHADERGSREYNLALGERRAKSVRRILVVNGVDSERLEVVSFGEEKPMVEGSSEDAYAQNRRVKLAYDGGRDEG